MPSYSTAINISQARRWICEVRGKSKSSSIALFLTGRCLEKVTVFHFKRRYPSPPPLLHWLYSSLVTMRTRSLKAVIMVHPAASLGEICSVRVADSPLAERRILCGHDTRDDRKRPGKGLPVVRVRVEGRAFEGAEVASVLVNLSGAGSGCIDCS